jgi:hypothetical protein
MVLKIVRYLVQQGYGSDKLVVLTPYLGQLRALTDALSKDNDPILNELDSSELARAGLLSPLAEGTTKKKLRLATIGKGNNLSGLLIRPVSTHCIGQIITKEKRAILLSRLSPEVTRITISVSWARQSDSTCFYLALATHSS